MTHVSKRALDPEQLSCAQVSEVTLLRNVIRNGSVKKILCLAKIIVSVDDRV